MLPRRPIVQNRRIFRELKGVDSLNESSRAGNVPGSETAKPRRTRMNALDRSCVLAAAFAAAMFAAGPAQAAKPIAYPAKGQSQNQQAQDDGQCYGWARSNTGIDPAAVANAPPPSSGPAVGGGERARGAARGAVIGGIANGSDGARTGAAVGVVAGGVRARQNRRAQDAQAQSNQQGSLDTFYRAYGACMEGRGYTIR
jgi:hypothetical protein